MTNCRPWTSRVSPSLIAPSDSGVAVGSAARVKATRYAGKFEDGLLEVVDTLPRASSMCPKEMAQKLSLLLQRIDTHNVEKKKNIVKPSPQRSVRRHFQVSIDKCWWRRYKCQSSNIIDVDDDCVDTAEVELDDHAKM